MLKRASSAHRRRSHMTATEQPPPKQNPWIMATTGFSRVASEARAAPEARSYSTVDAASERTWPNCEMSAPEMNASSPAPRIKSTRRSLSSATCATKPGRACHISILTALRRSGRLKVIQARGGSFCNNKDWLGMGCSSLPKCRDDLVGEQAQVLADVLGPTGERKDDRLGAHIEIFLEPFLTFLRRTGQGVAIDELRKVLGVVPPQPFSRHLACLVAVGMHCGEDEQARGEGAHVPAIFLAQTSDSIEDLLKL